ncbi:hypothetical protein ACTMU2_20340 [Cupriavidus basilensis]
MTPDRAGPHQAMRVDETLRHAAACRTRVAGSTGATCCSRPSRRVLPDGTLPAGSHSRRPSTSSRASSPRSKPPSTPQRLLDEIAEAFARGLVPALRRIPGPVLPVFVYFSAKAERYRGRSAERLLARRRGR